MEATKDRATEYWDNEIKRAAENTAKALVAYQIAKKEEEHAFYRKLDADANGLSEDTREFALENYKCRAINSSYKWDAYIMASKWESIIRRVAASYKLRKSAKKANK